jgi:hypothetical protein
MVSGVVVVKDCVFQEVIPGKPFRSQMQWKSRLVRIFIEPRTIDLVRA